MEGQVSSSERAGIVPRPGLSAAPASVRGFWPFLKAPALPDRPARLSGAALTSTVRLLLLDLALLAPIVLVAGLAQMAGYQLPDNVFANMPLTGPLITLIVIGAPLMEELLFRSWLSGRPQHIAPPLLIAAALAALILLGPTQPLAAGTTALTALVVAGIAAWRWRGRNPLPFFRRHFRWFYLAATAAFASVHLTNYTEGTALFLLPLVIPQFLTGLVLGYVRVRNGLWSAILLHALHNGVIVGAVLLATRAAGVH